MLRLSLLLKPVESIAAAAVAAAVAASAALGILQWLQVPNLGALLLLLLLLFHFRRSFLICSTQLDCPGISICAKDV
jgi:hypothetical protein